MLALSESRGDIFISSHFESELVTSKILSDFISLQFQDIIQRRLKSQENLDLFKEYILADCHTVGNAFVNNIISKKDLIKLLEKADKFRKWLLNVPEDFNLIGEYHKAITKETIADKLPTKTARFGIFTGVGIALDLIATGGVGTVLGAGISAFDSFYLDKLISGWKPNHFIDKDLKGKLKIKN